MKVIATQTIRIIVSSVILSINFIVEAKYKLKPINEFLSQKILKSLKEKEIFKSGKTEGIELSMLEKENRLIKAQEI